MKLKTALLVLLMPTSLLFSGCNILISNLTPSEIPQNPSSVYALEMEVQTRDADIIKSSITPYVVIDGDKHPMYLNARNSNHFIYDYKMPQDRHMAKYYYQINYDTRTGTQDRVRSKVEYSDIYDFQLTNRYVLSMQNDRGLVGSRIPVMGRGFTPYDQITVGGTTVKTHYISSNATSFEVPALEANKTYPVKLESGLGSLDIGEFKIDKSPIYVNRTELNLSEHERALLVFQIEQEAPDPGIALEITTDIPESIIMPEATIPAGARTISIMLEAGTPATGKLYVAAPGFDEIQIPITIQATSEESWM